MKHRVIIGIIIPLFFIVQVHGQENNDDKEKTCFEGININYSFVNIGTIHHWHVPTNIDEDRPYMHYTLGIEGRFNKRIALRLDYFSNYANGFSSESFFNPTIITVAPRIYFNISNPLQVFFDFKVGVAIISDNMESEYSTYTFANKPPIVLGLKTGLILDISKKFSIGFGFDNLGVMYKYIHEASGETGYDASRISIMTTDIVFHFKK